MGRLLLSWKIIDGGVVVGWVLLV